MKANETASCATGNGTAVSAKSLATGQSHAATFAKVKDGRKQPIRGLWERNGRFYARLAVENNETGVKSVRRIPLLDKQGKAVNTIPQAVAELKRLQTQRADNALPVLHQTPKFSDYAARYLKFIATGQGTKAASSIEKDTSILNRWIEAVGALRLDQIKRVHVNRFIEARLEEEVAPRTVNLDIIAFRSVLKRAVEEGIIQRLPTEGLKPLKGSTEKRPLFTSAQVDAICAAAFQSKQDKTGNAVPVSGNAQQLADYIRLMAYCGARRNEALGIQWADVDSDNGQLHLRRQITRHGIEDLKNHEGRVVDFNPKLRAHLEEMKKRRAPDSIWLFPSPQRGDKDIPTKTFKESIWMARSAANLPTFGCHDCRHHFISMCVMSGIDFMTIAAWVGHKDGGVLIGKVYGHLANDHRKAMADKLSFEPTIVEKKEVA